MTYDVMVFDAKRQYVAFFHLGGRQWSRLLIVINTGLTLGRKQLFAVLRALELLARPTAARNMASAIVCHGFTSLELT